MISAKTQTHLALAVLQLQLLKQKIQNKLVAIFMLMSVKENSKASFDEVNSTSLRQYFNNFALNI